MPLRECLAMGAASPRGVEQGESAWTDPGDRAILTIQHPSTHPLQDRSLVLLLDEAVEGPGKRGFLVGDFGRFDEGDERAALRPFGPPDVDHGVQ